MKVSDAPLLKKQVLQWANTFDVCCYLDSNGHQDPFGKYEMIVGVGAQKVINFREGEAFDTLAQVYKTTPEWMFGVFSYDLKNETENLTSSHIDIHCFPAMFFFIPEYIIAIEKDEISILKGDESLLDLITNTILTEESHKSKTTFKSRISKERYIETVQELQRHISKGNIYEITFCQEFFAEHAVIDPLAVFSTLNRLSPMPFAGYFKIYDQYILSASPERFLRKINQTMISQPIKGTIRRGDTTMEDNELKSALRSSKKEQSENVMIVDLVRNDLAKSALKGTVMVNELFGIYTFANVHQMISTVSCTLNPDVSPVKAIQNTFPMGSMTGAPKVKAMQLIEQYESTKRGSYSGAMGYITPTGDFDFNVVIRSLLYSHSTKYLSFQVGGAITSGSDPQAEYEESMLKGISMIKALQA